MHQYRRPEGQCPHPDLDLSINHINFEDSNLHYLEVKATCKSCGKPMAFRGMPFGCTPAHPTMAIDGSEITIPFLGEGEELLGKAPGFVGRQVA